MASALLEVAIQPAFQEKLSYTMAIRALLGGGSAMVCRMTAFTVENQKGNGGMSVVVVAAAFANSSAISLLGMPLCPGAQMRMVGLFLLSSG